MPKTMRHRIKSFLGIVMMALFVLYIQPEPFPMILTESEQLRDNATSDQSGERNPSVFIPTQFSLTNLKIQNIPFIPSLKNPCWFQEGTKGNRFKLRCLPYFFIAGQPKSATTDLHCQLVKHPDINRPLNKEPQWWTRRRFQKSGTWNSYVKKFTLTSYLQNECGLNSPSQTSNISSFCKRLITLDSSPSTFWDMGKTMRELKAIETQRHSQNTTILLQLLESSQLKSGSKNNLHKHSGYFKYTLADLIHLQLPQSRIIVILRNPVDRLYSGYRFFRSYEQKSALKFHMELKHSLNIWNNCLKRNSHRFCLYDHTTTRYMKVRLYVSIYVTFVEDWLKVFPRNQILFIRTEDYKENEAATMKQICEHLELRPFPTNTTTKGRKLWNISKIKLGPMLNKTRKVLTDFYAPFNRQLAQILEDDRFLWKD